MNRRTAGLLALGSILLAAAAGGWAVLRHPAVAVTAAPASGGPGDYDAELAELDRRIADLEGRTKLPDMSPVTRPISDDAVRLVYLRFVRASLTREPDDFRAADAAADSLLRQGDRAEDLLLLKTHLDTWFHRLPQARARLGTEAGLAESLQGIILQADLDVQEGDYDRARVGYERARDIRRTWDVLARLGHLASLRGDLPASDRLYAEAEDELTAKEMRSYAWVELQRGLLEFNRGRHDQALAHYRRADRAYSGYWPVQEQIAEVLAAQGNFDAALALYTRLASHTGRPEAYQALGDLYAFMGKPESAAPWHEKTLAAYLESAGRGEVQYCHHLASFYADVRQDGPEAVKWARRDLALRKNYATYDALAWAHYRAGQINDAITAITIAVSFGVQDAHLFFHAAMIHSAAGRTDEAKAFVAKAVGINPHHMSFHVHR